MILVRFFVLILLTAFSLVLGLFGRSWLDIGTLFDCCGYWFVAGLALVWGVTVADMLRGQISSLWSCLGWKGLAWVTVVWLVLISREPTEFKVLMDEPALVATSQGMHFQRSATMPMRWYEVGGIKEFWGDFQDKRPLLFPFAVSLVHDATGYRVENVFWLNKALVFVLLLVAWFAGKMLDDAYGGALILLWFFGWPILAQNACGGGFEILNLTLIMVVFVAAVRWLSSGDYNSEAVMLYSCLLLAHTRYESVLYLLVFAGLWLTRAIQTRRWAVSWLTAISPLFLVPVFWQRQIAAAHIGVWEFRPGVDHAFGFDFVRANFQHALNFLFVPNADLAGSPLFAALGVLALIGLGICLVRGFKRAGALVPGLKALGWLGVVVVLSFGVLLSYHWGQLDDPVVSRLILPLVGVMGLAGCAVRPLLLPTAQTGRLILAVMAFWIVGYALPLMSQHRYSQNNIHTAVFRWARLEVARTGARAPLIITNQERLWLIYGMPALNFPDAASRLKQIEFHRSVRTFDEVYLIQSFMDDPTTRQITPLRGSRFRDGVLSETIAEKSFYPFNLIRISRVKAIDLERVAKDGSTIEQFEVFRKASPAEMKSWRDLLP